MIELDADNPVDQRLLLLALSILESCGIAHGFDLLDPAETMGEVAQLGQDRNCPLTCRAERVPPLFCSDDPAVKLDERAHRPRERRIDANGADAGGQVGCHTSGEAGRCPVEVGNQQLAQIIDCTAQRLAVAWSHPKLRVP